MKIVTITGIRPDFIRMSAVFRELDKHPNIEHIMIHTGQHFDKLLSDVFFDELEIRKPDYNLSSGAMGKEHYHVSSEASVKAIDLIRKINPDYVMFLGDANTVSLSLPIKRDGWKIIHIEAGMRNGDEWMPEEINRVACNHVSHKLFAYHNDYRDNMLRENISADRIYVVGNTIVEVCQPYIEKFKDIPKKEDFILVDIHRSENIGIGSIEPKEHKLRNIVQYVNECIDKYDIPAKMLRFGRTFNAIEKFNIDLGKIEVIDLMGYNDYMEAQYHCKFMISDSGTAHEEPALLNTPVIVPRQFTERPQSIKYNCSVLINTDGKDISWDKSHLFLEQWWDGRLKPDISWLGDGKTAKRIVDIITREENE
jgi:UDP-N-acetylglucosamine 2-epimerase